MRNPKLIDDIREGKAPLVIGNDGLPVQLQDGGIYEMKEFIPALSAGYMRLYNRIKIQDKCNGFRKEQERHKPPEEA